MTSRLNAAFVGLTILIASCNPPKNTWDYVSFYKPEQNPIVKADSTFTFTCPIQEEVVAWQKADVFNPGAIVKDDRVYLLLRCEDNSDAKLGRRTSRIGLAYSEDGINFTKLPEPVLYPDHDEFLEYNYPGGCEDPRIVETEEGLYVVTYTAWNYDKARLSIAFSSDLLKWVKKGPAFLKAQNGKFMERWSKSGSIITKMKNGRQVAAKINGKYWMYWGENDINLAWSEDLYNWNPTVDESGELVKIVSPRKNKFDSRLVECGPPALITEEGVMLYYNGKNADEQENADPDLPLGTYSVGKIVFDINDLSTVISRSETPFIKPTLPHETTGQYQSGTTFAEGLVYFKSKWFLYYGTADSFVGVAVSK